MRKGKRTNFLTAFVCWCKVFFYNSNYSFIAYLLIYHADVTQDYTFSDSLLLCFLRTRKYNVEVALASVSEEEYLLEDKSVSHYIFLAEKVYQNGEKQPGTAKFGRWQAKNVLKLSVANGISSQNN